MRPLVGQKKRDHPQGHRRYWIGRCPISGKRSFKTRAKAVKDLKQVQSRGLTVEPYLCECGKWHLTSSRSRRPRRVPQPKGTG
jgi:hypothetical protein